MILKNVSTPFSMLKSDEVKGHGVLVRHSEEKKKMQTSPSVFQDRQPCKYEGFSFYSSTVITK